MLDRNQGGEENERKVGGGKGGCGGGGGGWNGKLAVNCDLFVAQLHHSCFIRVKLKLKYILPDHYMKSVLFTCHIKATAILFF